MANEFIGVAKVVNACLQKMSLFLGHASDQPWCG